MNSAEIKDILKTFAPPSWDVDVFPRDQLPEPKENVCLFAHGLLSQRRNTLDEGKGGYYFDSYGLPPLYKEFTQFLRHFAKDYTYSDLQLQSPFSTVCGHYCVLFALYTFSGYSIEDTVNHLQKYSDWEI